MAKTSEQRIVEQVMRLLMYELGQLGYSHADIAEIIGLSPRTVDKYPSCEVTPKLGSFLQILKEVQPQETLQRLCVLCGGLYVPMPKAKGETHEVLKHMGDVAKEFGEVVNNVSLAINPKGDGGAKVTKREAKALLTEVEELLMQVLIMKQVIEEIGR